MGKLPSKGRKWSNPRHESHIIKKKKKKTLFCRNIQKLGDGARAVRLRVQVGIWLFLSLFLFSLSFYKDQFYVLACAKFFYFWCRVI